MSQQPATATDAKNYQSSHGYPTGYHHVADPKWMNITQAITHGSGYTLALPYMIILDGADMMILYSGNDANQIQQNLINLTGQAPTQPKGCDGICGSASASPQGCYCDTACLEYNDCCADACSLCNVCP